VRIVLDTNVIVAAFASRGLCAEVFEVCITGHTLVTSDFILDEIRSSLLKKLKLPKHVVREVIEYLRDVSEIVEPDLINRSVCKDKDDLPVIGTATKGNASYIVTGDADLLSVENYRGIDIITPRQFWERLR
jgi:putative PIN family toxin of toxin-antitoxin system